MVLRKKADIVLADYQKAKIINVYARNSENKLKMNHTKAFAIVCFTIKAMKGIKTNG